MLRSTLVRSNSPVPPPALLLADMFLDGLLCASFRFLLIGCNARFTAQRQPDGTRQGTRNPFHSIQPLLCSHKQICIQGGWLVGKEDPAGSLQKMRRQRHYLRLVHLANLAYSGFPLLVVLNIICLARSRFISSRKMPWSQMTHTHTQGAYQERHRTNTGDDCVAAQHKVWLGPFFNQSFLGWGQCQRQRGAPTMTEVPSDW